MISWPKWKVHIDNKEYQGTRDLYIIGVTNKGERAIVNPLLLTVSPRGTPIEQPTVTETREEIEDGVSPITGILQAMLDEAWKIGMRPQGYDAKDSSAEIAAIRYHLEDMRLLAKVKKQ